MNRTSFEKRQEESHFSTEILPTRAMESEETHQALPPELLRERLGITDGRKLQDYSELTLIGIGGVGSVFSGREPGLNREVALKMLRPQFQEHPERIRDFIREARTTAWIDHPNIVPVHHLGVFDDSGVYFTMKRIEGNSLQTIIRRLRDGEENLDRRFSLIRLLSIFIGCCNGVAFAHRNGIIHGDLKPGNLMIGHYGETFVVDWGMATYYPELDQGKNGVKFDQDCSGISKAPPKRGGTLAFMAPELLSHPDRLPDAASDIYALGTILYSILSWQLSPFPEELTAEELAGRIISGHIALPHQNCAAKTVPPPELEAICRKAMAKAPEERYASVEQLRDEVQNFLDGYPVSAYSPGRFYRFNKLIRRRPLIPMTLLACFLTGAAFFGYQKFDNYTQSQAVFRQVEHNAASCNQKYLQVLRMARRLRALRLRHTELAGRNIERQLIRELLALDNLSNMTMENISRLPEEMQHTAPIPELTEKICRASLGMRQAVSSLPTVQNALVGFLTRWYPLFNRILPQGCEHLLRQLSLIRRNLGRAEIMPFGKDAVIFSICDLNGNPVVSAGKNSRLLRQLEIAKDGFLCNLNVGDYLFEYSSPDGGRKYRIPFPVFAGSLTALEPNLPSRPVPPGFIYVPGSSYARPGPFFAYGTALRHLPGFAIGKYEVTFREYFRFWKDLKEPQRSSFAPEVNGKVLWLDSGAMNPPYRMDLPVTGVTIDAARAYSRWLGGKYGLTGRLPTQFEREKVTSGIDGRSYPWGSVYQRDRALLADHPDRKNFPAGASPGSFPEDRSLYGVMDLAGNVREFIEDNALCTELVPTMGGSYLGSKVLAVAGNVNYVTGRAGDTGFRVVLEIPQKRELNHD